MTPKEALVRARGGFHEHVIDRNIGEALTNVCHKSIELTFQIHNFTLRYALAVREFLVVLSDKVIAANCITETVPRGFSDVHVEGGAPDWQAQATYKRFRPRIHRMPAHLVNQVKFGPTVIETGGWVIGHDELAEELALSL